jgi:hypothetical protein
MNKLLFFFLFYVSLQLKILSDNIVSFTIEEEESLISENIILTKDMWIERCGLVKFESFNRIFVIQEKGGENYVEINDGLTYSKCFKCNKTQEMTHFVFQEYRNDDYDKGVHIYKNGCFLCTIIVKFKVK